MGIVVNAIVQFAYGLQANLPSTGATGQAFYCTDTGNLYVWNGSEMALISGSGGGGSGFSPSVVTKTANYTTAATNYTVLMNSASNTTVTLTTSGLATGWVYNVANINTGVVTIQAATGNIMGQSSVSLALQYQSLSMQFDGTNFWII
jgi:hypothetical protein